MIEREPPETEPKARALSGAAFLLLFSTPFAGFGLLAVYKAIDNLVHGKVMDGLFFCIFGFVFSGVGFGLMFATIFGARLQARTNALKIAHPNEPWLWRKDWADGRINSSTKAAMWLAWIFAAFWNSISSGVFFSIAAKKPHDAGIYVAMLFPIIGLGLLFWAMRQTLIWIKFGKSTFKMLAVPGVIGGRLGGAIETSVKIKPEDGFHLRLVCLRRVVTGSGKSSSTTETVLWENEKTMTRELLEDDPRRTGIPVSFQIPPGAEESDDRNPRDRTIWRLEARAKVPGIDYKATFEVPVFRTAESAEAATSADPALPYEAPAQPFKLPNHSRIKVNALPDGGAEFYFPAARNPGMLFFTTLFFLIWSGVTVAAYLLFKSLMFEIIFTLIDVLLAYSCFNLWFRSSRVTINGNTVRITCHWLLMGPTRALDACDVTGFETKGGMQYGQTMYYNLQVRTRGGRLINAAAYVPGMKEADWLCEQMTKALPRRA
jgi:hypothetical protein